MSMTSLFNPLALDLTSSNAIDRLLDDVLPVEGEQAAPLACPGADAGAGEQGRPGTVQSTLVHKDMWENFLADEAFDPQQQQGADRGKRSRAAASISSICSDDVPFRASFSGKHS